MNTLQLKAKYGWTEKQVRKRLKKVDFLGHDVWLHKLIAHRYTNWAEAIRAYEKHNKLKTHWKPKVVQTFNWRKMRGSNSMSWHSFGIAMDIDPKTNPMDTTPDKHVEHDIPHYVINLAKQNGIEWGGTWTKPQDAMHFQIDFTWKPNKR